MTNEKIKSIIEGILFAWGDPVVIEDLAKVLKIKKNKIIENLQEMKINYEKEESGLRIVVVNDTVQISTKPENYEYINNFVKVNNGKNLSNAALETLSIVAYKQPVTKIEIEEIRGVKCDSIIKTLTDYKLIEVVGKLERIGKPNLYATTEEFLKRFGLKSIKELPELEKGE